MTVSIALVLAIVIIAALSAGIAKMIHGDGYGSSTRRPPASHLPDMFDPTASGARH